MRYTLIIIALLFFSVPSFANKFSYGARFWQGARHNPVGLASRVEANMTWIYATSDHKAVGDQKVTLAARIGGPAIVIGGIEARWEPLRVLELRLGYHRVGWLQLSRGRGVGASFATIPEDFGSDTLRENGPNEEPTFGDLIQFTVVPKMKIGPVIAFSQIEMSWWGFPKGRFWYESNQDTIVKGGRGLVTDTLTLLGYQFDAAPTEDVWILAGVYGLMLNELIDVNRERVGVGVVWRGKATTVFSSIPTLQLIAGYNLQDLNRKDTFFAMGALQLDWTL